MHIDPFAHPSAAAALARTPLDRRTLLAGVGVAAVGGALAGPLRSASAAALETTAAPVPVNPLVRNRADAQIFRHTNGVYYMTGSVPEYDRLVLRRSRTLAGLSTAPEAVLWRRPTQGKLGGYIWAPELHQIDGRWYMYFAAGDADDPFHIRTYVLATPAADPFDARWEVLGQLETPWDTFTLDSTSFVYRGTRYLCWAQHEPDIDTNSNLYLAPLGATPTQLAAPPVRLSVPTLPWEIRGFKVNEAPAFLARNGKVFLTYSASATDARYCLGLLTADADADLLDAASWTKSPTPVFVSNEVTSVYGPGHNSFTVDEQGRDVLVYHGRDYAQIQGDPLFDPNRHTRVQRLYYREDGTPNFGIPVGNGRVPDRLSPADRRGLYLEHDGTRVLVGPGRPLKSSQFRQVQGGAGTGTVSLEAIDAPGSLLRASFSGEVSLSADRDSSAYAEQTSFRRRAGLSDAAGVSFQAVGAGERYLQRVGSAVRVATAGTNAARAAATFSLS